MRSGLRIFISALVFGAMQVHAQETAADVADIRCVFVGMKLAGTAHEADQSRRFLLTLYYIGRLDGRVPKIDIENMLIVESDKMNGSYNVEELKRCGAAMIGKGEQITKIGRSLIEREKKRGCLDGST